MKMIAVDLDGTLLNSESKISKENIDAIKKAREHGIEVVVATGEHPLMFKRYLSRQVLKHGLSVPTER